MAAALFSPNYRRRPRRQAFSACGDADHWSASDLTSQEFAGIASFALLVVIFPAAFLRRRDAPGLYIAAFWLFAALTGWSCGTMTDGKIIVTLWIVLGVPASVEIARDIRARRVPESAPSFPRHPTQPG
ncbi:hypothetical protein OG948_09230 [Embleya sp. NBC_00888]|uniref:hypothetical protein n=1 Tax=Embleya sp. NBC_00888 TaxID=2975960 RepID=UPI003870A199|nr:hypothetical protein OG948_09230 [Embleya sp. NBC_00888]